MFENGQFRSLLDTELWESFEAQPTLLGEIFDEAGASSPPSSAWDQRKLLPPDAVIDGFKFNRADFPLDKSDVARRGQEKLVQIARMVLSGAKGPILLLGHTDPVGTHIYNVRLGKRRAETIRRLLEQTLEGLRKGSSRGLHYIIDSPGELKRVAPNDSEIYRALNRRVEVFLLGTSRGTTLPARPEPTPPYPPRVVPPNRSPQPPKPQPQPPQVTPVPGPLPFPNPFHIDQPPPKTGTDDPPSHWVWHALAGVAGVLGVTLSSGLRALTVEVLEKAIFAALVELTAVGVTPTAALGAAGEAVAQVVIEDELRKKVGSRVFNLNTIRKNFPVFDLIWPDGITSVKTYGGLVEMSYEQARPKLMKAFREMAGMQEPWETRSMPQKLTKAAQAIWDNLSELKRQAPNALPNALRNAKSVGEVEAYLANNGSLRIPDDFIARFRKDTADFLIEKWSPGNKRLLGPQGLRTALRIKSFTDRIQRIGLTSGDIRSLVEVARETGPAKKKPKR
jgi:outer membrane protein OmpA-like peptidoglycan-associated protein